VGNCAVYERRRSAGETGYGRGEMMQKGGCAAQKRVCKPQDRKPDGAGRRSWAVVGKREGGLASVENSRR